MDFEKLKDLVEKKPTFVKFVKIDEMPDALTERERYLLVTSVKKGSHSNGYQDWEYVNADYSVSIELTYLTMNGTGVRENVGRRIDFLGTKDIVNNIGDAVVCNPPKSEVTAITSMVKQRAVEAIARVNTWCKVMGEEPVDELKNEKDPV